MTRCITFNISGIDVNQWMQQKRGDVVVVAATHRQVERRLTHSIWSIDANTWSVFIVEQSSEHLWVFIDGGQMNRQFTMLVHLTVEMVSSLGNGYHLLIAIHRTNAGEMQDVVAMLITGSFVQSYYSCVGRLNR